MHDEHQFDYPPEEYQYSNEEQRAHMLDAERVPDAKMFHMEQNERRDDTTPTDR